MTPGTPKTGFAADPTELADRRSLARRLLGKRIAKVVYVNIDYRGWELGFHDNSVRRDITDAREWERPTWDAVRFHHLDFGVELTTATGEVWGVTWDSPSSWGESLRLTPERVCEGGAAWDVTRLNPWAALVDSDITDVDLRYHPWEPGSGSAWCTRVSLVFGGESIEILLGDSDGPDKTLVPSSDNVVVLFGDMQMPDWERIDDLI